MTRTDASLAGEEIQAPVSMGKAARTSLWLLFLCYTANQLCAAIISFLAIPIKLELDISDLQFGVLTGPAFSVTYGVFAFLFAYFADRGNRVNLLVGVLVLWSIATIACGLAASFIQLLVARIVVAVGEAGGTPTTLALVSDSVPKARMSTAFSILMLSAPIGFLISAFAGSFFAGEFGWRLTFVICGALGFPIALMMKLKVRDPRKDTADGTVVTPPSFNPAQILAGIFASLKKIVARRSVVLILLGFSWAHYMGQVLPNWMPIFMNRYHGYSAEDAALYFGIAFVGGIVPGLLCGGFLADRLARISPVWRLYVPVLAICFSVPMFIVAFNVASGALALAIFGFGTFISQLGMGPTLGAFNAALPSRIRATGSATLVLAASLIAGGLGNITVGGLSDFLTSRFDTGSLRIVLSFVVPCFATVAVSCLLLARRNFVADLDSADSADDVADDGLARA